MKKRVQEKRSQHGKRRRLVVPVLLLFCVTVVVFWEVMASYSSREYEPFDLTEEDFVSFRPGSAKWVTMPVEVEEDHPSAPSIVGYRVTAQGAIPVTVRLVHGYNMAACMELKGYTVALLYDGRTNIAAVMEPAVAVPEACHCQVWRLTSDIGDESIWCTMMLGTAEFGDTGIDTRSVPFPRIHTRLDPGWEPQGVTMESLKDPVGNLTKFFQSRWNGARCDLLTFLRLRQPEWVSEDIVTLVAQSGALAPAVDQDKVTRDVILAHQFMHREFREWRALNPGNTPD